MGSKAANLKKFMEGQTIRVPPKRKTAETSTSPPVKKVYKKRTTSQVILFSWWIFWIFNWIWWFIYSVGYFGCTFAFSGFWLFCFHWFFQTDWGNNHWENFICHPKHNWVTNWDNSRGTSSGSDHHWYWGFSCISFFLLNTYVWKPRSLFLQQVNLDQEETRADNTPPNPWENHWPKRWGTRIWSIILWWINPLFQVNANASLSFILILILNYRKTTQPWGSKYLNWWWPR